ncbi:hypothetical protein GW17_00007977 [Ensete ventricosum]|nr:hypothetical protein GW17_00007977 [Ensete ventricosum]
MYGEPGYHFSANKECEFPYSRFAISTYTARYRWYIPVRQVTDTRTARYQAVPLEIDRRRPIEEEIDRWQSIEREIDRRQSIEEEKWKKKRKRKKKEGKKEYLARAPSSPACRRHPQVARGRFFSRARKRSVSPHGETDRGNSARLPIRGPPTTGRYRQNRPWVIDYGPRRSIEGEEGKKKKRKRRKKKKRGRRKKYLALSSLARCRRFRVARASSPLVGRSQAVTAVARRQFFSRAGRKIEATSPFSFTFLIY